MKQVRFYNETATRIKVAAVPDDTIIISDAPYTTTDTDECAYVDLLVQISKLEQLAAEIDEKTQIYNKKLNRATMALYFFIGYLVGFCIWKGIPLIFLLIR